MKRYFDVSPDWRTIAAKGGLTGAATSLGQVEYAKPVHLSEQDHGGLVRKARASFEKALVAVPWKRKDNQSGAKLFCVFSRDMPSPGRAQAVLQQRASPGYKSMLPGRERLPAHQRKDAVLDKFRASDVLVICGATGCGKTTQLPQQLMEMLAEEGEDTRIICTQPRRISATSVAERVAQERGDVIGGSVGYQIRFEHKATADTSLLYCTVGILLRHLATNPTLEGVGVVVVDEVHERDVHTDFALLILRDLVRGPRRGSLKLVLMSATINAQGFVDYFRIAGPASSGPGRPGRLAVEYYEIPGKTNYPIEEYWMEDILDLLPDHTPAGPPPPRKNAPPAEERNVWATEPGAVERALSGYAAHTCRRLVNHLRRPVGKVDFQLIAQLMVRIANEEGEGAVLIFVPGWQDISDCMKALEKRASEVIDWERWQLFPLHSMVPPREQKAIFQTVPRGVRKVIISTNIAETSITVEEKGVGVHRR